MKVPETQRQVDIRTAPEGFTPVKQGTVPDVMPASYGIEVNQNLGQAGKALQGDAVNLAAHYDKMMLNNEHKDNLRRETAFRQDFNQVLYDPSDETVTVKDAQGNDKEITRKKGIMLRTLSDAAGATAQARQAYQGLREKYITGLSDRQASTLSPALDNRFIAEDENVIKHEVSQLNADMKDAAESYTKQTIMDIASNRDAQVLRNTLNNFKEKIAPYNSQFNEATQKYNIDEGQLKIVNSNIENLMTTVDHNAAKAFLESVKGDISDGVYTQAAENLESKWRAVEAQKKYLQVMYGEKNNDMFMDKVKTDTLTFQDVENNWALNEVDGGLPKKLLLQYKGALERRTIQDLKFITDQKEMKPGKKAATYTKSAAEVRKTDTLIQKIIDPNIDKWQAREAIVKAWKDGILTGPEVPFYNALTKNLDNIRINRANNVFEKTWRAMKFWEKGNNLSNEEMEINTKALVSAFMNNVPPEEILPNIKRQSAISANPTIANADPDGTEYIDPYGHINLTFPNGDITDAYDQAKSKPKPKAKEKNK